jgi:hypothetical protein
MGCNPKFNSAIGRPVRAGEFLSKAIFPGQRQAHFDLFLRNVDVLFNYMRTSVARETPFFDRPA